MKINDRVVVAFLVSMGVSSAMPAKNMCQEVVSKTAFQKDATHSYAPKGIKVIDLDAIEAEAEKSRNTDTL